MTQNPYDEYVQADFDRRIRCACSTYLLGFDGDERVVEDMAHTATLCITTKRRRP